MQLLLVVLCIFNIFLGKLIKKGLFNPAMIYTVLWSFFIIFPCLLWRDIKWNYGGLLWIAFSCTSMVVGQGIAISIFNRHHKYSSHDYEKSEGTKEYVNIDILRYVVGVLIIACLLRIAYSVISKGFSLSVFYNLSQLLSINNYSAYNRYNTEESVGTINQIFLIIQYSLPIFGGYLIQYSSHKKEKIFSILTLLPVTLGLLVSNAKAGFIAAVFNFATSYIISYYLVNGKYKKISSKTLLITILAITVFIGILFISMCMRVGDFSASTIEYVKNRIMVYAFGQMKAFDEWYSNRKSEYTIGVSTYMWIFNRLGIIDRAQGVYGYASSIRTNVYTEFRGIINDFGVWGGQLYIMLRGMLGGYLTLKYEKSNKFNIWIFTSLVSSYLFILYGFIISPWIYTTYALMYVFFILVMVFIHRFRKKNERRMIL